MKSFPRFAAGATLFMSAFAAHAQSPWDQGTAFLKSAWKRVEQEGPKAAEAAIRSAPERFKQVKTQVTGLQTQVQRWAKEKKLEERKNLALELWRIRGSLDLMALLEPEMLHRLTGIDAKTLKGLQSQVADLQSRLGNAIPKRG